MPNPVRLVLGLTDVDPTSVANGRVAVWDATLRGGLGAMKWVAAGVAIGLAPIATSGSASDLSTGTVPVARLAGSPTFTSEALSGLAGLTLGAGPNLAPSDLTTGADLNITFAGAGKLNVVGTVKATGYQSSDGSAGSTTTFSGLTYKNGLLTAGTLDLSPYATTAAVAAGYQPLDNDLTQIAALTTTSFGRGLLTSATGALAGINSVTSEAGNALTLATSDTNRDINLTPHGSGTIWAGGLANPKKFGFSTSGGVLWYKWDLGGNGGLTITDYQGSNLGGWHTNNSGTGGLYSIQVLPMTSGGGVGAVSDNVGTIGKVAQRWGGIFVGPSGISLGSGRASLTAPDDTASNYFIVKGGSSATTLLDVQTNAGTRSLAITSSQSLIANSGAYVDLSLASAALKLSTGSSANTLFLGYGGIYNSADSISLGLSFGSNRWTAAYLVGGSANGIFLGPQASASKIYASTDTSTSVLTFASGTGVGQGTMVLGNYGWSVNTGGGSLTWSNNNGLLPGNGYSGTVGHLGGGNSAWSNLYLRNDYGHIIWGDNNYVYTVGIQRDSAGLLKVTDGASGQGGLKLGTTGLRVGSLTAGPTITASDGTSSAHLLFTGSTTGGFKFSNSPLAFFGGTPAAQVTVATITNNMPAGGTTDTIDTWSDLTTYATDAGAIRNAIYQLARKVKQIVDGLRVSTGYALFA